jgi:hypothetical protein
LSPRREFIMDLALEMGTTVGALSRAMTERELRWWHVYAEHKQLPQKRLELYLAQIALVVATALGGMKQARLADFLFDTDDAAAAEDEADATTDAADITPADLVEQFGGRVYRKKPPTKG